MKNQLRSALLFVVMLFAAYVSNAQDSKTFYVCSATSFTMVPQDTNFLSFQWTEVGGTANPISTAKKPTITGPTLDSVFTTKRYTLSVKDSGDCWSTLDTFTVHFLPPIAVKISGDTGTHCTINGDTITLAATLSKALTLPAGVTADVYTWTLNNSGVGVGSQFSFVANDPGNLNYSVEVGYTLPSQNGGEKLATCTGTASKIIKVYQTPNTPTISIQ